MNIALLNNEQIETYAKDGVIVIRNVFSDYIENLQKGIQRLVESPGEHFREYVSDDENGRFFADYCNWERIPEFRSFIESSPVAHIAGEIMQSHSVQVFHDHVLVKEPGTSKPTPWHQDMPYYCVQGSQTVSFWIPLDPVTKENTLRLVRGSHIWPKFVRPLRWFNEEDFYSSKADQYMELPDIEGGGYDILETAMEPGDAVLFHFSILHGARGNIGKNRRRAFSLRFIGDDVTFAQRDGNTSPPYPDIGLADGERMREDWFPVVWIKGSN